MSVSSSTLRNRLFKQRITFPFQNTSEDLAGPGRAAADDFIRRNIDLTPSQPLKRSDGGPEYDLLDAAPQHRRLAHRAGFGGRVENKVLSLACEAC